MRTLILYLLFLYSSFVYCQSSADDFTLSTWTSASQPFVAEEWKEKLIGYEELGIDEILVSGEPEVLEKIIPLANQFDILVHAWIWIMNRPGDSVAMKHPEWYAVNRNGDNSLEYRAYVDYYQWLSPFHPEARAHIKNNVRAYLHIEGLASVHLDYIRYPDVILGADLQPKYNIKQDRDLPQYDYDYHPMGRVQFKEIFGYDPLDLEFPELSMEWKQFRLDAVTDLVNEIVEMAHTNNRKVSAAVFPFPTMSRRMVGQAWDDWNLDMAYPMLYQNFYRESIEWIGWAVAQDVRAVDFPVIAGLYMPAFKNEKELTRAIALAGQNGADGISLFTADNLDAGLRQALRDAFKN